MVEYEELQDGSAVSGHAIGVDQDLHAGSRGYSQLNPKIGSSVTDDFPRLARSSEKQAIVNLWEGLMTTLQQPLPQAVDGERRIAMTRIFNLQDQSGEAIADTG